ncbi:MAG: hypothetical protein LBF80_07320, partial [Spirochaetaceae bacterium]|nr:hypothetical protein [Spirochaetaceae bacterium]
MKKIILTFSILFCLSVFIYGQDNGDTGTESAVESGAAAETGDTAEDEDTAETWDEAESEDTVETGEDAGKRASKLPSWMTGEGADLSTGRRESRTRFELGLLDLTLSGIWGGIDLFGGLSFDLAKIDKINVDLDILASPLYVRIPVGNIFVLDVFTGADVDIKVNLSEKTIDALKKIESLASAPNSIPELIDFVDNLTSINAGMSAGASAFTEFGAGASKTLLNNRLWVRAAPSLYFTLLYMKQSSVSMKSYKSEDNKKIGLEAGGAMDLYSAWDLDGGSVNPFASPGLDITLQSQYALWPVLDLGVSVFHIPIIPSTLTHRMGLDMSKLSIFFDTSNPGSMKLDADLDEMITSGDDEKKTVMRPVRFDFYGLVKPFRSPLLVIQPNIGATVNTIFADTTFNW